MQKNTQDSLSPRDLELLSEKAKLKIEASQKLVIDGEKIIKKKDATLKLRKASIDIDRKNKSYKRTMKQIQGEMPLINRLFSKIIHIPIIEGSLNLIANTILRPNAILFGSIMAFLLGSFSYYIAKQFGYATSGSEVITAFVFGWILGTVYDLLYLMTHGHKIQ